MTMKTAIFRLISVRYPRKSATFDKRAHDDFSVPTRR